MQCADAGVRSAAKLGDRVDTAVCTVFTRSERQHLHLGEAHRVGWRGGAKGHGHGEEKKEDELMCHGVPVGWDVCAQNVFGKC